ncbi:uncharacterized protein BKA55DRAFT_592100 [Fusarium redolens]|uniref:Uncharacterized protein n=1 Tax=Fusarium redolens TaxID=48865 RepID=A0A9P9HMX1_FUSRE|nr:uncharacterized protein BKA55DRAFT_592100 [Fusarium redolens]KAH7259344.1 hypothetical protein BKA55DRAFT_592100 [Fusarium redolens]
MRYVNEIKNALIRAQSIDETPTPPKLGLMRMFKLWSIDHIKHCHYELDPARYIEFEAPFYEWDDCSEEQRLTLRAEKNYGHIYSLSEDVCQIGNLMPPEYRSTKTHNLGTSDKPVYVQFFDDNYLTLKISRQTVFSNHEGDIPWDAPSSFTYYGICERYMVKKARQEYEEREMKKKEVKNQ